MSETKRDLRVIFVGNSQVGKTTLMNRYIDKEFTAQSQTTINPVFSPATATTRNGTEIVMQLWDTAGQEKYQALSQVFYRDSHVAAICFDPNDQESVKSVPTWKNLVIQHEPKCSLVLVATKLDLVDQEKRGEVGTLANNLAHDIGVEYSFLTSSVTNEGVIELFTEIATIGEGILTKGSDNPVAPTVKVDSQTNKKNNKKDCNC